MYSKKIPGKENQPHIHEDAIRGFYSLWYSELGPHQSIGDEKG
jgi:hypothetical protein